MLAAPLSAKESLGIYSDWGAFRDAQTPRCYAIALPTGTDKGAAFAGISTYPKRQIRNQVHFRLSRYLEKGSAVRLRVG